LLPAAGAGVCNGDGLAAHNAGPPAMQLAASAQRARTALALRALASARGMALGGCMFDAEAAFAC